MRTAWIVVVTVGIAGCSGAVPVDVIPSDVEWVAFLLRGNGGIADATPFVRIRAGESPDLPDHDGAIDVIGFDDATIRSLSPPDDRIVEDALFLASTCDIALPAPAFSTTYIDEQPSGMSTEVPRLSAAWLADRCPKFDMATIAVDDTCLRGPCAPPIEQERCCLRVDMGACGLDEVVLPIGANGELAYGESTGESICREQTAPDGASVSSGCTEPIACRADVYVAPSADGLTVDRLELLDVPILNTLDDNHDALRTRVVFDGYLGDILAFDDHIVVSTFGGEFRNYLCHDLASAELVFIDADALTIQTRLRAPTCTAHLIKDPRGEGRFFGTSGRQTAYWLHSFDEKGTVTASTAVRTDDLPGRDEYTINDAFVGGSPASIFIVLAAVGHDDNALLRYDFDLRFVEATPLLERGIVAMDDGPRDEIILIDDFRNEVVWYDTARSQLVGTLPVASRGSNNLVDLRPRGTEVFVPGVGEFGAVHVARKGEPSFFTKPFLIDGSVTAIDGWDGDTWITAVTRHRPEAFEASISLFDPTRPRFLAPRIDVGPGAVSRIASRKPREAFMLFNWSGDLLRVTAD